MNSISFNSIVFLVFLTFLFSSCGTSTESSTDSSESGETSSSSSSKLDNYQDKPCELLTEAIIRKYVATDQAMTSKSEINQPLPKNSSTCIYTWKKKDDSEPESYFWIEITMMDYKDNKRYFDVKDYETVEGIGEKAYFNAASPLLETLFILSEGKIIILTVDVTDEDRQTDTDVAKKIAKEIL